MRIVSDTADRLTLEEKPWIIGIILTVVILFLLALALMIGRENLLVGGGLTFAAAVFGLFFVVFVRRVIVIFDRAAGAVVIRSASMLGQKEQTIALADIDGVKVETQRSRSQNSDGRSSTSVTHRAVLQTRAGDVPLTLVYTSGKGAEAAADTVRRWLG